MALLPEEMSPEVQNRGISGPTNGYVPSNKFFFRKKNIYGVID